MPNWVENDLTIRGSSKELNRFKNLITDAKNIANKLIPYPEEYSILDRIYSFENQIKPDFKADPKLIEEARAILDRKGVVLNLTKDGFNQGGYKWCIVHWGTKWDFDLELRSEAPSILKYSFETAWSPPLPVIQKLGERFPALSITLHYHGYEDY